MGAVPAGARRGSERALTTDADTIRRALSYIPADDRDTWVKAGMAVKAALGENGFDAWNEWSRGAGNYEEQSARSVWKSIREDGGVGAGTLFYIAEQHGFRLNGEARTVDPAELERYKQERAQAAVKAVADRKAEQERAAGWAQQILEAASDALSDHPYLQRKAIAPCASMREIAQEQAARILEYQPKANGEPLQGRLLVLPITVGDRVTTLELIDEAGRKSALYGGAKAGGYWAPHPLPADPPILAIAEGAATAASIRDSGYPVVAALAAGNLPAVARAMREKYPKARIVICGDIGNGEKQARAAAKEVGGVLALPASWDEMPEGADFNDLARLHGVEEVKSMIDAAIRRGDERADSQSDGPKDTGAQITEEPALLWPEPLDLEALAEQDPERPKFIIADWLPVGYATLLAGHGGVGKSSIALTLAVCVAAGVPFFGLEVDRRRVLYLSCEDRKLVLHWRLRRICAHLGVDLSSLDEWLKVLDLVGRPTVLWDRDPKTGNTYLPAFGALEDRIEASGSELVVVDGISDTFGGNENARGDVKRFVNTLVSAIDPESGAVLLVGHISKPSAANSATSEGYSGSTGWHNAARARWYLYPETERADEAERPAKTGRLLLELQKSNLGRTDREMSFTWDEEAGLFVGKLAEESHFDRRQQERDEERGILLAFKGCAETGIVVPAAAQGPNTAFMAISLRPEFPEALKGGGKARKARFRRHVERMRQIQWLEEAEYRRTDRHTGRQIRITTLGVRECG